MGIPPIFAVGTDLAHSAASKALGSSLYLRGKAVNARVVGYLMVGSLLAIASAGYLIVAIRGAYGPTELNLIVGLAISLILILAGGNYLLTAVEPTSPQDDPALPPSSHVLAFLGFVIGLAINTTSVGAGSMLMPYLMRKLKSAKEMVGTDLAFGFLTTATAALLQSGLGNVLPSALLYLLAGSIPGTYVGVRLNDKLHVRHMRRVLGLAIMVAGILTLIKMSLP
jgi:uncharacterized membrane protein YfcA